MKQCYCLILCFLSLIGAEHLQPKRAYFHVLDHDIKEALSDESQEFVRWALEVFHAPTERVKDDHEFSHLLLEITKALSGKDTPNVDPSLRALLDEVKGTLSVEKLSSLSPESVADILRKLRLNVQNPRGPQCDYNTKYRTMDGSCNHPLHPCWGQAAQGYARWLWPDYADGLDSPRVSITGHPLPNARKVSSKLSGNLWQSRDTEYEHVSSLLTTWGQFLAHETALTPTVTKKDNKAPICCGHDQYNQECLPIRVAGNDPFFPKNHCMEFARSSSHLFSKEGCSPLSLGHPREQVNQLSTFIDASNIYGSSEELMKKLRMWGGYGARLAINQSGKYEVLPRHHNQSCRSAAKGCDKRCPLTGENRAGVTPILYSLHTLFVREHNRLVDKLSNRGWSEEKLFQEVRRIIGAMIQHISYREFLPLVVGESNMKTYGLTIPTLVHPYDPKVNPRIYNVFTTVAFRFGHSMVDRRIKRARVPLMKSPRLAQEFFSMDELCKNDKDHVTNILEGQMQQKAQKVDCHFTKELTNHLFSEKADWPGLDLLALDIQRGRDHGIPGYLHWRKTCGLKSATSYESLTEFIPEYIVEKLENIYGENNVLDIDLFVGGIAEYPLPGAILGPTFSCIIAEQFRKLKFGDRFWYEHQKHPGAFTKDQILEIQKTTLSGIMCRNLDLEYVQEYALRIPGKKNEIHLCSLLGKLTDLNLNMWL